MIYLDLKLNLESLEKEIQFYVHLIESFVAFYYIYFIFTSYYHVQYNLIKKKKQRNFF